MACNSAGTNSKLFTAQVQALLFAKLQVKFAAQNLRAELLLDIFQRERKMCLCLMVGDCNVNRTCIVFSMP
jgi:hypothetical protein